MTHPMAWDRQRRIVGAQVGALNKWTDVGRFVYLADNPQLDFTLVRINNAESVGVVLRVESAENGVGDVAIFDGMSDAEFALIKARADEIRRQFELGLGAELLTWRNRNE